MPKKYVGKEITVVFDSERCIHSRNCVLGLPNVFIANAEGPWIQPDNTNAEELKHHIRNCPSGALRYTEAGAEEPLPKVNTVRVWENGPYSLNAEIEYPAQDCRTRATLCRCGASKTKPYCDCSHKEAGFTATGELDVREFEALEQRDGKVKLDPKPNGPLFLWGNLEVVTGTGKTIDKKVETHLCRCGGSSNKPYCDGTHAKIGFTAE